MEDLSSEVGEFGSFAIGDFRNGAGGGHQARIGGEQAIDVGPDDDFAGVECGADDGGGVIGTAATESGERAIGGGANETGDDRNDAALQKRKKTSLTASAGEFHAGIGSAMIGIGDDEFGGLDGFARSTAFGESGCEKRSGHAFAKTGNGIASARRDFAEQESAVAEAIAFLQELLERADNAGANGVRMNQGRGR